MLNVLGQIEAMSPSLSYQGSFEIGRQVDGNGHT
jgi:hypothetical protein